MKIYHRYHQLVEPKYILVQMLWSPPGVSVVQDDSIQHVYTQKTKNILTFNVWFNSKDPLSTVVHVSCHSLLSTL